MGGAMNQINAVTLGKLIAAHREENTCNLLQSKYAVDTR